MKNWLETYPKVKEAFKVWIREDINRYAIADFQSDEKFFLMPICLQFGMWEDFLCKYGIYFELDHYPADKIVFIYRIYLNVDGEIQFYSNTKTYDIKDKERLRLECLEKGLRMLEKILTVREN